ncbi:MAG: ATPase [Spirochaetae bacterium HGW-Spirochaetae-6]|nr:MAG: ATPase [Spirochaetae bacterium HGW-Spirochaetae-6]
MTADVGTTWTKIRDEEGHNHILPTRQILREDWFFRKATGHLGQKRTELYCNELEALGHGALKLIGDEDFTVVDIGSRDTKFVRFAGRKVRKLDWNQSCGASTGFTLELLLKYYELAPDKIKIPAASEGAWPVTCAVFGIERIFDTLIQGGPLEEVLGQFVLGLAKNVYEFTMRPKLLYLSGGLCENPAFVQALSLFCKTVPLGRFVLLEGLSV